MAATIPKTPPGLDAALRESHRPTELGSYEAVAWNTHDLDGDLLHCGQGTAGAHISAVVLAQQPATQPCWSTYPTAGPCVY